MPKYLQAIQFKSLDEAAQVLKEAGQADLARSLFDDGGQEPRGLLSVIPSDLVEEEVFYRLFDQKKGTLVQVERISYSGFGPPAEAADYMGFVGTGRAYVLKGRHLPVEIEDCPWGAADIHHLEALVLDGQHPLDRADLARRMEIDPDWQFEDLFQLILTGQRTAQEIDRLIHMGVH
ncbi:MAG TPA: hypothetical protein VLU25_20140 [Acidobacteriota bacterium]|nr:hypothetical protein [Acidobacteriota bacterium]